MEQLRAEFMQKAPVKTENSFRAFIRICELFGFNPEILGYDESRRLVSRLGELQGGI